MDVYQVVMENGDWDARRMAAEALARVYESDVDELLPYLEREKTVIIYYALIKIGKEGTESALIRALNRFGYVTMAEDYLNCGNPKLEKAAEDWADEHGYRVLPSFGGVGGVRWGSGL